MIEDSRSSSSLEDELRLPRSPGIFRRFWSRHPLTVDIIVTVLCLLFSLVPSATFDPSRTSAPSGLMVFWPVTAPILVSLVVAGCATLLVRRRWPFVSLVAAFVVSLAYLLAPFPAGGPLLLVAAYSVAVYRSTRACVIGLAVGLTSLAIVVASLGLSGAISANVAWNAIVGEAVMGLIGALIGANVGNRRRYVAAIIQRSRQLIVERDQQAELSAAAERARIAREMHDIVSHSLTVIVALADGASVTTDTARARAATEQVGETARTALREMRAMLGVLREGEAASSLAPLAPLGDDAVTVAVDGARRAGFPVSIRTSGDGEPSSAIRLAVARLVQEGLTNAMRHAPGATRIDIDVATSDADVTVTVRNDGVTGPQVAGGYGLRGLRERVGHVGGELSAGPDDAGRWVLRARIPREMEKTV